MLNVLAFEQAPKWHHLSIQYATPLCVFVFLWLNNYRRLLVRGSLFGKHKLFPQMATQRVGKECRRSHTRYDCYRNHFSAWSCQMSQLSITSWVGLGFIVVVFGTWGDLVENLFKRTLGIKDSGKILHLVMAECSTIRLFSHGHPCVSHLSLFTLLNVLADNKFIKQNIRWHARNLFFACFIL